MSDDPRISYSDQQTRVELHDGDELVAYVDLRPAGASTILAHTEVLDGHEGEGLGRKAVRAAVDHIVADGKTVLPVCPFATGVIRADPELAAHT